MTSNKLSRQNMSFARTESRALQWRAGKHPVDLSLPRVMGAINLTPDSFSDGGECLAPGKALDRARRMEEEGADIIDLGAESSRPGRRAVSAEEEKGRLLPVLEKLALDSTVPLSVDTRRTEVARLALEAGASIINDITAGAAPGMLELVAEHRAGLVLMHMLGSPETMQDKPRYDNVVAEVRDFLLERAAAALEAGVERENIVIDPGVGFGKNLEHNLRILREVDKLAATGFPVLIGASRKRFIGEITGAPVRERLPGNLAVICLCLAGGASVFRVHEVGPAKEALAVARAIIGNN